MLINYRVLSDHGRCYAFDSRAGGFGRGEGVAAIIVKRLDDAIRDGDSIRSIIRGSATNQDGKTPGITMPSHEAQVKVIKKAYAQAGLDPCNTCYVEAHGKLESILHILSPGIETYHFDRYRYKGW